MRLDDCTWIRRADNPGDDPEWQFGKPIRGLLRNTVIASVVRVDVTDGTAWMWSIFASPTSAFETGKEDTLLTAAAAAERRLGDRPRGLGVAGQRLDHPADAADGGGLGDEVAEAGGLLGQLLHVGRVGRPRAGCASGKLAVGFHRTELAVLSLAGKRHESPSLADFRSLMDSV